MSSRRAFAFSLCMVLFSSTKLEGLELPTTLTCRADAKASRNYDASETRWHGQKGYAVFGFSGFFKTEARDSKESGVYSLRDKVFSGLNTNRPTVRSTTRFADGFDQEAEFTSRVVSRVPDAVFLLWTNDFNKVWLAAID